MCNEWQHMFKIIQDKNRTISAVDGFVGVAISVQQEKNK